MAPPAPEGDGLRRPAHPRPRVASSLLSPAELGATLDAGAEPIGIVQGSAAMASPESLGPPLLSPDVVAAAGYDVEPWSSQGRRGGLLIEDPWREGSWNEGFDLALARLVDDASALGAHGVVGIRGSSKRIGGGGVVERRLLGTAVVVPGAPPPPFVWTTHLKGAALAQVLRSGSMPVAWVTALGALRFWYSGWALSMRGGGGDRRASHVVGEWGAASEKAVSLALRRLQESLGADGLLRGWHRWWGGQSEVGGQRERFFAYALVGTRVRRFREPEPAARSAIRPTVNLR